MSDTALLIIDMQVGNFSEPVFILSKLFCFCGWRSLSFFAMPCVCCCWLFIGVLSSFCVVFGFVCNVLRLYSMSVSAMQRSHCVLPLLVREVARRLAVL